MWKELCDEGKDSINVSHFLYGELTFIESVSFAWIKAATRFLLSRARVHTHTHTYYQRRLLVGLTRCESRQTGLIIGSQLLVDAWCLLNGCEFPWSSKHTLSFIEYIKNHHKLSVPQYRSISFKWQLLHYWHVVMTGIIYSEVGKKNGKTEVGNIFNTATCKNL